MTQVSSDNFIFNLYMIMMQASAPIAAVVVHRWGDRATTWSGAALTMSAFLATALMFHLQVKQIFAFYIVTGGLVGLGFGFMYLPAMSIIDFWFSRNLGLATGIAAAGSGVGQFALAPLTELMIKHCGLPISFIILASISATGLFFGIFYVHPTESSSNNDNDDVQKNVEYITNEDKEARSGCFKNSKLFKIIGTPEFPIVVAFMVLFHFGLWTVLQFTSVRFQKISKS